MSEAYNNKLKMTSTSFNVGLTDDTRLSSRVLRPPGGGHTDIFGGEPEPTRGRRAGPPPPSTNNTVGQGDAPPTNGFKAAPEESKAAEESKPKEAPAVTPTEAKTEAPKRVRVPPGGFSSGLW